ncbi:MAG: Internalin A [Mycoplasmataceae bacterium]|nr:MAG: Internalin A [Mycoplasmataceae bacterium]
MINAQQWLDNQYPRWGRWQIEILNIDKLGLIGELDLSDFVNLQYLSCSFNQLTDISLSNCKKLTVVECGGNDKLRNLCLGGCNNLQSLSFFDNYNLTNLNLSCANLVNIDCRGNRFINLNSLLNFLNPEKVKRLEFGGYNGSGFSEQDLSCFSRFINLEVLRIENNNFIYLLDYKKNK